MKTKSLGRVGDAMTANSHAGHGDAYRWLRERYDLFRDKSAETMAGWQSVAKGMAAEGIRGRQQQIVSADSLRQIWKRVVRDLHNEEREKLGGVKPRKKQPRDMPANFKPAPITPTASPSNSLVLTSAAAPVGDSWDYLDQQLKERSGH